MEYIYAALLLHRLSKEINEDNLKKVIASAGAEPDESKIKTLIASLKGVDIDKALEEAVSVSAPVSKKEEKKVEEKERPEATAEGLASLFG